MGVKLTLMGGAASDTLSQGDSKTYTIRGKTYDVTLDLVNDGLAKFVVNGEITRSIKPGNTFPLDDGSLIGVREVIFDPFAQGARIAEFYIGANKVELEDNDITDSDNGEKLVVGTDKMKSAEVKITGRVDVGDSVEIDTIELDIRADEDVFLPAGSRMSAQLEEPEVLLDAWDIQYSGLETANVEEIVITASDDDQYTLEFADGSGEGISVPLLHATGTKLRLGDSTDLLVLHENQAIGIDDYFVVSDASQDAGDRETYVLQYEGAEDEEIDFAIVGGDDKTEDYDFGADDRATLNEHIATIDVSGKDYRVYYGNTTLDAADVGDDFAIKVDLNGDGTLATSLGQAIVITTNAGATITITDADNAAFYLPDGSSADVNVTIDEGDGDAYDNSNPSPVGLLIKAEVTDEVDGTILGDHNFVDRNDDSQITYTTLGALIEHDTRDDAPTLRIDYPLAQRLPQLLVVTPEVQVSGGGDDGETPSEAGALVYYETTQISAGTARLAREVGDITAQNAIVMGGPCANTAAATILDNPEPCGKDFSPNTALIKLIEHDNGNVALLVAGYDPIDTRRAARVVAEYEKYQDRNQFVGMGFELTGTSFTDITITPLGGQ